MFREPTAWDKYAVQISIGVALLVLQPATLILVRGEQTAGEHG